MSYRGAITDSDVIQGLSVRYLKIFGLWRVINDYRRTGKRNAIFKFKVITTLLLTVPYIFSQYLSFFFINVDIQKATFLNLHSLPALQICCKILVLWFRMESQCRLYDLIRNDFLTISARRQSEAKAIYMEITKKCNWLIIAAFSVNTSIVVLSIADPGISVDYIAHHTGSMLAVTGGKKKILGGWYPVPMAESPYYEAIFVYEILLIGWGGILLATYAGLYYQVLMCLYAQFAVLGHHLSSLKVGPIHVSKRSENQKSQSCDSPMYNELYVILKDHQKLLSYAKEIRSVYNPLVTMILGVGIFVLVIGVFQFLSGGTGSPMLTLKSLQFLAYQGIEVCMFCFGSSFIQTASSDLQLAIYSSDWYKADIKFRKTAQMVMLRAGNGETLTAIRMYPVNVETIMAILRLTYSVTALMSRMAE